MTRTTDAPDRGPRPMARLRAALPYLLTAALFAAGAWALYHLLRSVDIHAVMAQVRGTPPGVLALALACTFGAYLALVGYDWSALRHIGKPLPLRSVLTGGFLGYAIGNTVGAGPVTGGLVRFRVYSALGLSGYDIAGIAAFGSIAFGVGATLIGSAALAYHPYALEGFTSVSTTAIRWIALAVVAALLAALAWLAIRRPEGTVRGVALRAPTPGILVGQIGFTAADMLLAATTLYLLLPPSDIGFATFLAVFAAAALAGVISHVPGGVGVFETVVIAALPASVPVADAAAGLLLYRLVYYLVPFACALVLLAVTEARMGAARAAGAAGGALGPLQSVASALVPQAVSVTLFASGVLMLVSSLIPPTSDLAEESELLTPLAFLEGGALLSSALGAAMVIVAHGLLRRVEGAWWLAVGLLAGGIAASLAHGLDWERATVLAFVLAIMLPMRAEFHRTARLTRGILGPRWLALVLGLVAAGGAVLLFGHKATPYAHELWWQFAVDESAPRSLRAGFVGALVLGLGVLMAALRPGTLRPAPPTPEGLARAAAIVRGQPDPDANIALTGDKSLLFSESGESFLMYAVQGRSWVALHGPVGAPSEAATLAWEFHDAALAAGARPVFYAVPGAMATLFVDMGLILVKQGEEAVVPLAGFGLEGSHRKKLRTAHNRALRDGLRFEMIEPPVPGPVMDRLSEISDEWLAAKAGGEKGFSLGRFDADLIARAPVATVIVDGRIVAFANLWRTDLGRRATIDLMRHADDAPPGLMDFLFTELMLHLRDAGYEEFSLGGAPLSGLEARRGAALTSRLGALVYRHGRQFYNFEGLRAFKEKFDPNWRSVYVALPPRTNLVAVAADLVRLVGSAAPARGT